MPTFDDVFQTEKTRGRVKEQKAQRASVKDLEKLERGREGNTAPAKQHRKDDPAVRKERKERRKGEKVVRQEEEKVARKAGDERKQLRSQRAQAWREANAIRKEEEAAFDRQREASESVVYALGMLQALAASGTQASYRTTTDMEYLQDTRVNLRGKKEANAALVCEALQGLAEKVEQGVLNPYPLAARLSAVAMTYLNSFDSFLEGNLDEEQATRIKNWMTSQRSHVSSGKKASLSEVEGFVPADPDNLPTRPEGDDEEAEEAEEGEEAEEDEEVEEDEEAAAAAAAAASLQAAKKGGGKKRGAVEEGEAGVDGAGVPAAPPVKKQRKAAGKR